MKDVKLELGRGKTRKASRVNSDGTDPENRLRETNTTSLLEWNSTALDKEQLSCMQTQSPLKDWRGLTLVHTSRQANTPRSPNHRDRTSAHRRAPRPYRPTLARGRNGWERCGMGPQRWTRSSSGFTRRCGCAASFRWFTASPPCSERGLPFDLCRRARRLTPALDACERKNIATPAGSSV